MEGIGRDDARIARQPRSGRAKRRGAADNAGNARERGGGIHPESREAERLPTCAGAHGFRRRAPHCVAQRAGREGQERAARATEGSREIAAEDINRRQPIRSGDFPQRHPRLRGWPEATRASGGGRRPHASGNTSERPRRRRSERAERSEDSRGAPCGAEAGGMVGTV